jgi:two-component system, OmpR family, sensor kinase
MRPRHYRRRRMGPLGRYVRASLRRRLFAWFIGSIVLTVLGTTSVISLLSRAQGASPSTSWQRVMSFGADQFAARWADPVQRAALADEVARGLDLNVELHDVSGVALHIAGSRCRRHTHTLPVMVNGARAGEVVACSRQPFPGWMPPVAVFCFAALMWLAAGKMARRLARPLDELTHVVQRIGTGDLKARAELSCAEPGEIGLVADAVNDMASRIEKQMADQRELLATVSHELRTPLARLRIVSELARETGATVRTFDDLDREVADMNELVGQLLASSRLDFGTLTMRPLSARDVASRAIEHIGASGVSIHVEGEGDEVVGDATLLHRALANLLDNANKHGRGIESLAVAVQRDAVRFEVLDRGPGIEGDPNRLFEKFKKSTGDGLGLGLALVRRVARAHGGEAWAAARDGGGARVGFWVPRREQPLPSVIEGVAAQA